MDKKKIGDMKVRLAWFVDFWNKGKWSKAVCILVPLLIIGGIGAVLGGDNGSSSTDSYSWPDGGIAEMLPTPKGDITYISAMSDYLSADVDMSKDDAWDYLDECKKKGFTVDAEFDQYGNDYDYEATNAAGYELTLWYDADYEELNIILDGIDAEELDEDEDKPASSSTSVSPDFKQMMDEYEAFMDQYIAFMKKYENSDDVASMMGDYASIMSKYSEFSSKVEAVDEDNLSDADYAYYTEVMMRVNKKLMEM